MTTSPPDSPDTAPAWRPLDATQRRVLGVLIEKAKTTPAGYPMSVNAIVTGCNQKNNRDPVTTLDDLEVGKALEGLQALGAVQEVDWMGRVSKYKHRAYEWLRVSPVELAVLGELLLRGAQTLGELRARASRMEAIADLGALKPVVDGLLARGLMVEITPPGRGQLVSHNLYPPSELSEVRGQGSGRAVPATGAGDVEGRADESYAPGLSATPREGSVGLAGASPGRESDASLARVTELSREVETLREEVVRLREQVDALEARLGAVGE